MSEWTDWKDHKPGDPCPIPNAKADEWDYKTASGSWGKGSYDALLPITMWDEWITAYRTLKGESP